MLDQEVRDSVADCLGALMLTLAASSAMRVCLSACALVGGQLTTEECPLPYLAARLALAQIAFLLADRLLWPPAPDGGPPGASTKPRKS